MGLDELRRQIDAINLSLLELLNERARVVQAIGRLKREQGLPLYDPEREEAMLTALTARNPGPLSDEAVRALFKEIARVSLVLMQQEKMGELLVSRRPAVERTIVRVGRVTVGRGLPPVLIAGPCAVESEEQLAAVAQRVRQAGPNAILRGGAFKPRTSPYSFQGLGQAGLRILRRVADAFDLPAVSEVLAPGDVELVAQYADMLQVGARAMHNTPLLAAVGRCSRPVLLKRGYMATVEEFLLAAEYILSEGNGQVVLCERGIRTFEPYTRNTLDVGAIALLTGLTHLPVIADPSHAAGRRDLVLPLARAALAAGAAGVMVEVHPNPAAALSDGAQALTFDQFEELRAALEAHRQGFGNRAVWGAVDNRTER